MKPAIEIDGSQGEGGGQMVRSSLGLALVTGTPVKIANIRAGREKPGLMRQHLTAVQAAAEVCQGDLRGAAIGSRSLEFEPRPVRAGNYHFRVGTAGSATLVLQTVLPALLIADGPSTLTLEGGTHNQWAPPFDFLARSFLPLVNRLGPRVTARLERAGFHPAGGGRFTVQITPSANLAGFDLLERGSLVSRSARALVSNLPLHIAEREVATILRKMTWDKSSGCAEETQAHGPGNVVFIEIASEHVTEVFTGFGRAGVKAERVADEAIRQARDYLATDVPVGPHLADQLMLPLGISAWQAGSSTRNATEGVPYSAPVRSGGWFRTLPLTPHSITHIEILKRFLAIEIAVEEVGDGACEVRLAPGSSGL